MEADLKDQIRDLMVHGAQPVSLREISERRTAPAHAIPRATRRRRAILTGAGVGLAAAGCAAGLVIATAPLQARRCLPVRGRGRPDPPARVPPS